jgi:flagellar biosynthesis protein FlhF
MKIKRYFSQDYKNAVEVVESEIGCNAVIISKHHVNDGVAVTAVVDEEETCASALQFSSNQTSITESPAEIHDDLQQQSSSANHVRFLNNDKRFTDIDNISANASSGNDSCTKTIRSSSKNCKGTGQDESQRGSAYRKPGISSGCLLTKKSTMHSATEHDSMTKVVMRSKHDDNNEMLSKSNPVERHHYEQLNSLVEQQIIEHAWGDVARKNPLRAQLIRKLLKLEIHPVIIQKVTDSISGDNAALKSVFPHALALIANQLPIFKQDVTACGGTVALFGATGAGKTTTIAKMAARYALKNGPGKVGLVTTDGNRLGAKEQLGIYSEILGIPLKVVRDDIELLDALNAFSEKPFVLIDTAGMGPKEVSSSKYFDLFTGAITQIKNLLVLPATSHRSALEKNISAFQGIPFDGSIISKLDETASLGGLLSVAIMKDLPVAYYSNGQKIPDDFHLARAHSLVSYAVSVAEDISDTQPVEANCQEKAGIEANVSI